MHAGGTCSPFYKASVRNTVEYAMPCLTVNQSEHLEPIQTRAIRIIEPDLSYQEALSVTGLEPLQFRKERMS